MLRKLQAGLRRHGALFAEYFTQYLKVRLSYRGDFAIGVATSMAATVFALGFVLVLFSKVPRLADWNFNEVLFLYGFSLIPFGLYNILSVNLYEFGNEYIMEGKFDRVLIRPVASLFQVLFENFRIESFQEVLVGLWCSDLGVAADGTSLEFPRCSAADGIRGVRCRDLYIRLPDAELRLVLVRGPHWPAPARVEPAGFRTLSALHL